MDRASSKRLCRLKHPGAVLATFIVPYGVSQNTLARAMGVSPRRVNEILLGKRSITADTAVGLAELFGGDALFWMKLQARYDIAVARLLREGRRAPSRAWFPCETWNECELLIGDEDPYLAAVRKRADGNDRE